MNSNLLKILYIFLTLNAFALGNIEIAVSDNYTETIDINDLTTMNGGSTINDIYEGPSSSVTIDVTGADYPFRVEISRSDIDWPSGVTLLVRRTSDASPSGNMVGGSNYQAVTSTDTYFFECTDPGLFGNKRDIAIQYRLEGVLIENLRAQTYSTTINFTVTENN